MTNRVHVLTVVLDDCIRDDDVEPIVEAIKQIRHVLSVQSIVANHETYAAEERARQKLLNELWEVLGR